MDEDKLRLEVGSQYGRQRLVLKIRMGVSAPDREPNKEPVQQPVPTSSCVCHCGKEFPSKKALGGHLRVHNQRDNGNGVPAKKHSPEAEKPNNRGVMFTCDICAKEFGSPKSLHGHMRKHPEREWRGMQPANSGSSHSKSSNDSTESDVSKKVNLPIEGSSDTTITGPLPESRLAAVDLLKSLSSWSTSGKRGRESRVSKPADIPLEEEDLEAARILMSLKDDAHLASTLGNGTNNADAEEQAGANNKQKKRALNDLETAENVHRHNVNDPETHVCAICGKSFLSYQALGGHMSSHNKIRKTQSQNRPGHVADHLPDPEHAETETDHKSASSSDDSHQCEICKKKFPTGQALGGHKRIHWTGTGSSLETIATSTVDAIGATTGHREPLNFDLDLNEVPSDQ